MKEPLNIATGVVGISLLAVVGRYVLTGELNETAMGTLGTIFGVLLSTLGKQHDRKGDEDD